MNNKYLIKIISKYLGNSYDTYLLTYLGRNYPTYVDTYVVECAYAYSVWLLYRHINISIINPLIDGSLPETNF